MKPKHLVDKRLSLIFFVYIWIMWAVIYMTKSCFSAAMASIVHEGVMTKSQTGLILALFYFVYAPFQVLGGRMADHHSPEKLITIGLLGAFFANLVIFLNQNYYVMLTVWTFNAAIQFGIWPSVFKIISSRIAYVHRKMGMFMIGFALTTGLLLAYVVAIFVKQWQYNFLISAILLLIMGVGFWIITTWMNRHMVAYDPMHPELELEECQALEKDSSDKKENQKEAYALELPKELQGGSRPIFWKSGFYLLVPVFIFYAAVSNSLKTFSATMLMESYASVSPEIGNFFNVFVILAGIAGPILVKLVLYPRIVKNEMKGMMWVLILSIPFMVILLGLGRIPVLSVVVTLCLVVMVFSTLPLLRSYFTMKFSKFGREGEAAGIANSGDSLGFTLQNYGITYAAESVGWGGVSWLLLGMSIISAAIMAFVLPRWKNFTKKYGI